jgi:hypothetical protein
MFGDKSVLGEDHPGYIGMYSGRLMEEQVRASGGHGDRIPAVQTVMSAVPLNRTSDRCGSAITQSQRGGASWHSSHFLSNDQHLPRGRRELTS